jgi:hypothetical protein
MSDQVSAVRARVEAAALEYHKATDGTGEGEYGCPGLSCPGVQRLANFWTPIVEAALRAPAVSREASVPKEPKVIKRGTVLLAKVSEGAGETAEEAAAFAKGYNFAVERANKLLSEASVPQGDELANTLTAMARRCDNWLCDENAGYDAALDLISSLMNELDQAAAYARALSSAPGEREGR